MYRFFIQTHLNLFQRRKLLYSVTNTGKYFDIPIYLFIYLFIVATINNSDCFPPFLQWPQRSRKKISQTYLCNFDPLNTHVYTVKLGFTGVNNIFSYFCLKIDHGYSLKPLRRGASNEYPQCIFWAEIWKNIRIFIWKFSVFGDKNVSIFVIGLLLYIYMIFFFCFFFFFLFFITNSTVSFPARSRVWYYLIKCKSEQTQMVLSRTAETI